MTKKYRNFIVVSGLSISIATILWMTIFSRLGCYYRHFYPLFSSYRAIFTGSDKALFEIVENIILFVPIGVALSIYFQVDIGLSLLLGFALSLIIESGQWFFWLGSFEIDDLIHNTIGTGVGWFLIARTNWGKGLRPENPKKCIFALFAIVFLIVSFMFGYQVLRTKEMIRLAALNDSAESKNLLILSPDPTYMGNSEINITYCSDGSVLIEGTSQNRAWIILGRQLLCKGKYSFSGLSGIEDKTISIVLDYYDQEQKKYLRLTKDIGVIEEDTFTIFEPTMVRALVSIYPIDKCRIFARPAIYSLIEDN